MSQRSDKGNTAKLDILIGELEAAREAGRGNRALQEIMVDILLSLSEASKLQTELLTESLTAQRRQTNAMGQLRKALEGSGTDD